MAQMEGAEHLHVAEAEPRKHFLSAKQVLYLGVIQFIGSGILNGGINFGLATAMYKNATVPTTVWLIPGTLAGDAAITIMIQVTLTWIIAGILTRKDADRGIVGAVQWVPPAKPAWLNYFFFGGNFDFTSVGRPGRFMRLFLSAVRGGLFASGVGILIWPLCLLYLVPTFGNDGIIPNWPTPQIFKGVLGAVLGLLTTPVISFLALVEAHRIAALGTASRGVRPSSPPSGEGDKDKIVAAKTESLVDVPSQ